MAKAIRNAKEDKVSSVKADAGKLHRMRNRAIVNELRIIMNMKEARPAGGHYEYEIFG